ncbi:hypothetical protein BJ508DRAFT_200637, partial [Ascobolus immersus RN42]
SGDTIRRALNDIGYHRCKACQKPFISASIQEDRRHYSNLHRRKTKAYWRPHMYCDESHFDTADRGVKYVTRKPNEKYHKDCIQKTFRSGRTSVMVWGAISYNWKSELVIL